MALRDLQAFLEDDGLDYPWPPSAFKDAAEFPQGKSYHVDSPDAKTGLWLTSLADLGARAMAGAELSADETARIRLDDDAEASFYQRILGGVYDEMLADGLKWSVLQKTALDAYMYFTMGPDAADLALAGQGKQAARANRAARRAAKRTAGGKSPQASTATATRTPKPASPGSSTPPNDSGEAKAV